MTFYNLKIKTINFKFQFQIIFNYSNKLILHNHKIIFILNKHVSTKTIVKYMNNIKINKINAAKMKFLYKLIIYK